MPIDSKVEDALRSTNQLDGLRTLAVEMQQAGCEQSTILDFFDKNRQALREEGREGEEDVVLELMDFLVGWCSPHMRLAPKRP